MDIQKAAIAGTLESSDTQITVEPSDNGVELLVKSSVMNQYGRQIKAAVLETLKRLGVQNGKVMVIDKGALECTLKARVECAVYRSCGASEKNILAAKRKWNFAIMNPLLISIVLVIAFLVFFRMDYESYNMSVKYLSYLLTPATVSLAIPLYQQLELSKKNIFTILAWIVSGVLTSLGTVFALSLLFQLSHEEYVTLLPKSITTAIGRTKAMYGNGRS